MKTTHYLVTYLASLFLGILPGCGPDPAPVFKYSYTVINTAGFAIQLSCTGCESVTVSDAETKEVKTNTPFDDYTIAPVSATIRKIDFEETSTDEFTVRSYEFDVIYLVGGTADAIDVTFKNASGVTEEILNVEPPLEYYFRDYASDAVFISAKNKGSLGFVQVFIYYKEELLVGDTNQTAFGTATASEGI